jgi:dynein light chain LC8-type
MYTSINSSSPVRTSTSEATLTNYQTQSYHSSDHINTMNENSRRGVYSNSSAFVNGNPLSPKSNYNLSPSNQNRYQSTSYRSYGNENDAYRSNNRAYSYDDLLSEQNRSQSSVYNTRNNNFYRQQQPTKRDQYNYDDDDLIVKSTDLPANYEEEMIHLVRAAFRKYEITNQRELAGFLKRSADKSFAPCWHCIVGRQFSSYVTHEMNGFIYFTKGPLSILLFKSGA